MRRADHTPDFYYSNYDCKVARRGPVQVMLHAPREEATLRRARRDYFGVVRNRICDHTKIVRGRTALGCRGGEGVSRSQQASYGDPARADKSLLSSAYS